MTRRKWLTLCLGCAGPALAQQAGSLRATEAQNANDDSLRHYRVDAQVLLCGFPILHRQGVGGGHARWVEEPGGVRELEFAGYSLPDRAAGLSRMGFFRERTSKSVAKYFGVMTASPEESAVEARKALQSKSREATYAAIEGRISPQQVETKLTHFTGPARVSDDQMNELETSAMRALGTAERLPVEFDQRSITPPPFLTALVNGLRQGSINTRYTYRGQLFRLVLNSVPDRKVSAEFRREVSRVNGVIQRQPAGEPIHFRIWVESNATKPMPLRIDWQPKGYLRLTLEAT
jgi:hypothetical protein